MKMLTSLKTSLVVATFLVVSGTSYAMEPIPGEDRFAQSTGGDSSSFMAGATFGQIGDDVYMQISPRFEFSAGKWGFGLQVPLNLLVWEYQDDSTVIRQEDWDEPSDFFRMVRYVQYGHKRDPLYARFGTLASDIGHGTIMSRYLNTADLNTFRPGLHTEINLDFGGIELMTSDVVTLWGQSSLSQLVGTRVHVKPMGFVDPESAFNIFAIGFSYVADLNAPGTLSTVTDAEGNTTFEIDDDGRYVVAESGSLGVIGIDVEADVLNTDVLDILLYTDYNMIGDAGNGLHIGTLMDFNFSLGISVRMPVRFEYRIFDADYIPQYFNSFYEIERFSVLADGVSGLTKKTMVQGLLGEGDDNDQLTGYYGDLAFDFAGLVQIGGILEAYEGRDNIMTMFASVPALEVVKAKAYYAKTGIEDAGDAFKLDDRSLLIAQAEYEIYPSLYFVGRFTRRWVLETEGSEAGTYVSNDDWSAGIDFSFDFN